MRASNCSVQVLPFISLEQRYNFFSWDQKFGRPHPTPMATSNVNIKLITFSALLSKLREPIHFQKPLSVLLIFDSQMWHWGIRCHLCHQICLLWLFIGENSIDSELVLVAVALTWRWKSFVLNALVNPAKHVCLIHISQLYSPNYVLSSVMERGNCQWDNVFENQRETFEIPYLQKCGLDKLSKL